MSSFDLDPHKIPAFKRKKELDKEAAKKIPWTALDRQRAGLLKEQKRVQSRRTPRSAIVIEPQPEIVAPPVRQLQQRVSISSEPKPSSHCEAIGEVTHYLSKINVVIIRLSKQLKKGSLVAFEEQNGLFFQPVDSMQINRKDVTTAKKGSEIGMKVNREPRVGGRVYLSKN